MISKAIIPEMITAEGFVLEELGLSNDREKKTKRRVKQITRKLADRIKSYKERAIQILENAEALDKLLEKAEEKMVLLGPKGKKYAYIPEMIMLTRSYAIKEYRDISFAEIVLITVALLYFLSPIDILPDFIPGVGLLDDALVMNLILKWCDQDIEDYMEWRRINNI